MLSARSYFGKLNSQYLEVHRTKEDLFWNTYMAISDDQAEFARAEQDFKSFVSDPRKLAEVRSQLSALASAALASSPDQESQNNVAFGLRGWLALFEANIVDNAAAQRSQRELIEMEAERFAKRRFFKMHHVNEHDEREEASLGMLSTNIGTNRNDLTDNPQIGPLLAEHYWHPGNSVDHNATLINLTGEGFSARHLAEHCNQTTEEAWSEAAESIAVAARRDYSTSYPATLDATIRIVNGAELIADNSVSDADMCVRFAAWVDELVNGG